MAEQSEVESIQPDVAQECQIETKQVKKRMVPQKGLWSRSLKESALFREIWVALNELGYDKGSDIPYFHFNECCEELNIDVDSIDIEKFCERFEVNIG